MANITEILKTVSSGASTLQRLADVAMQTQNVDLREGILSVREELIDVKESLLDIREENLRLRESNQSLESRIAKLQIPSELILDGSFYYTEEKVGPFCPACWESQRKQQRLSKIGPVHKCPVCEFSHY
jgi:hypothetical protein